MGFGDINERERMMPVARVLGEEAESGEVISRIISRIYAVGHVANPGTRFGA